MLTKKELRARAEELLIEFNNVNCNQHELARKKGVSSSRINYLIKKYNFVIHCKAEIGGEI